jgi:hypothetical protein
MSETLTRIDPAKPAGPVAYTADVRANFQAAQDQIDALAAANDDGPFLPLDGSVAMEGPLLLAADPVAPLEAATKQYADTFLPLAGGEIDGDLTVVPPTNWGGSYQTMTIGSPTTQSPGLSFLSSDSTNQTIAFVRYVNQLYLSCGNMDGSSTFDIGFFAQNGAQLYVPLSVTSLSANGPVTLNSNPTSALHAATKQYVDAAVAPLLAQIAALEARLT